MYFDTIWYRRMIEMIKGTVKQNAYIPSRQRCYRRVARTLFSRIMTVTLVPTFVMNSYTNNVCLQNTCLKAFYENMSSEKEELSLIFSITQSIQKLNDFGYVKFEFKFIS